MQNQSVRESNQSKSNPFKEYFQIQENEPQNEKIRNSIKMIDNKYVEKILGIPESKQTALETKINKNLSGKNLIKRTNTRFLS